MHKLIGFLAEGAFFGETPFIESISGKGGNGSGIRTRTIRTVCACDLGVIQHRDMRDIMESYPELQVRLKNFNLVGSVFTAKGKKQQEFREMREQAVGGGNGGQPPEPPLPQSTSSGSGGDVLDDAVIAGIESSAPPRQAQAQAQARQMQARQTAAAAAGAHANRSASGGAAELLAVQAQMEALKGELQGQMQQMRAEMAQTRQVLLAAILESKSQPVAAESSEPALSTPDTGSTREAGPAVLVPNPFAVQNTNAVPIGFGMAAALAAQTSSAARDHRRRRPSFE